MSDTPDIRTLADPCPDPSTCPWRLGDTCPHHPRVEGEGVDSITGPDILITAVEGGIGYWATIDQYAPDTGTAILRDRHAGTSYRLSAGMLLQAARTVLTQYPDIRAAGYIRRGDIDAEAADVIVQVATLGEITYG